MSELFITSTGTEVGKTAVSTLLVKNWLRDGFNVTYWKPVASGCIESRYGYRSPDEIEIIEVAGLEEEEVLATYRFEAPRSPDIAARMEDREVEESKLVKEFESLRGECDRLLVEGIGGVGVPLTPAGLDVADLIAALTIPSVLVVGPELGTISYTRTAVTHLDRAGSFDLLEAIVITPDRGEKIDRGNRDHLRELFPGVPVKIIPRYDKNDCEHLLSLLGEMLLEDGTSHDSQPS